jgi:tripartite-type tricarboxylate transporter receptor subunit TctC
VRATPDGYTLLVVGLSSAMNETLYKKLNFNFIREIAPVASIAGALYVMVINPSVPAKTVPEFIAYAKANSGKINMGSSGHGSVSHVFGERFKMMTGINLVHVPYRGGYLPDLLSGQVQVVFGTISSCIQYIRGGMLRALAVTTATRWDVLPDIPTLAEFLPGYEVSQWYGVGAPKDTPAQVIEKLNKEINAVAADPLITARLAGLGVDPMSMTSAAFGKFVADETEKWGQVILAADIKVSAKRLWTPGAHSVANHFHCCLSHVRAIMRDDETRRTTSCSPPSRHRHKVKIRKHKSPVGAFYSVEFVAPRKS